MSSEMMTFEAAIASIATDLGYSPQKKRANNKELAPIAQNVAMIDPSSITSKTNGDRCRFTSSITFTLLKNSLSLDLEGQAEMWCDLKQDAMEILSKLKEYDNIVDVTEVETTSISEKLSHYEEISIYVEATIVANFDSNYDGLQIV